jgi:hypothetical protein
MQQGFVWQGRRNSTWTVFIQSKHSIVKKNKTHNAPLAPQAAEPNSTGVVKGDRCTEDSAFVLPGCTLSLFLCHLEDATNTVFSHARPESKKRMLVDGFVQHKNTTHWAGEDFLKPPPQKPKIANLPLLEGLAPSELLASNCSKTLKLPHLCIEGDETTAADFARVKLKV